MCATTAQGQRHRGTRFAEDAVRRRVPGLVLRPITRAGILWVAVSRGPTRRVRKLVETGAVADELLAAANHEADLLGHPYLGVEHLELGQLSVDGRIEERLALREALAQGVPRRWWRPRGRRSALRRRGLRETEARRLAADREEKTRAES